MAESRRVHFTTLSPSHPLSSGPDQTQVSPSSSSTSVERGIDTRPDRTVDKDTVRLVLPLFQSDERTFPEFSFTELINNKINQPKSKNPQSRLEEENEREDEDLAAIARTLEEKYGGNLTKKKDRIQDLIDIGYGYDEEDSFIDNSEAYDEFVPAAITTTFGGFYINSGMLQFRQVSDSETDKLTTEDKTTEPSKKRKLNNGLEKPKKKLCNEDEETNEMPKTDPTELKKKKKGIGTLSVTNMLKKFQREKEKDRQKMEKANQKAVGISNVPMIPPCPADAAGGGGCGLTDPLLNLIGSTTDQALIQAANTLDLDVDLVSLLDATEESLSPKSIPEPATDVQLPQPSTNYHCVDQGQLQNKKTSCVSKIQPEQIQPQSEASSSSPNQFVSLPEGLTPELEEAVGKLRVAVKSSEGESKLKVFTPEINAVLLDIELQCREMGGPIRSKLYTHLSSFLPCSRDTLLKRVKKLMLTHVEEPLDLEDSIQKLKEAIGKAMPEQITCYHASCQAYEQVKASNATEEGNEGKQTEDSVEEKGVARGGPKKVFKWNEEISQCLSNVLQPKLDNYEKHKNGNQGVEDYLKTLLDNEVKPLWPKGWMQSRALMRESKKLLEPFPSLQPKKARFDKKQSIIIGTSEVPALEQLPQVPSFTSVRKEATAAPLINMEDNNRGGPTMDIDSSSTAEATKPLLSTTSAPAHSFLNILADQALTREPSLVVPQEILAAAIAKCKRSALGQHWSFGANTKSPPPPPQSSPVDFPVSRVCQVVMTQPLQPGDFTRSLDVGHVQYMSDDSAITIQ